MAWTTFRLGRPGYELTFDIAPNTLTIEESQIAASNRVLSGRLKKRVFRTSFPTITMASSFFTLTQRQSMISLLSVTDTMLSFLTRDDWAMQGEVNSPTDASTVPIQENSSTLLSQVLVAAGFSSIITPTAVWTTPERTGTNYLNGGTYSDAAMAITLGTPLPTSGPAYVDYTYTGWLVSMDRLRYTALGGQVDTMKYDGWILTGC